MGNFLTLTLMENQPETPPSATPRLSSTALWYIPVVLIIAVALATIFTSWTPGVQAEALPKATAINATAIQPTTEAKPSTPEPQLAGESAAISEKAIRIGLVSGHWKNDSGAVCEDGLKEADINLLVATSVLKSLKEQGYQVDLLAEFDEKLSGYQADALVSIHADSCDYINAQATGYKVGSSMANPHPDRSARLTACLRSRYGEATGLPVHSQSMTTDMTSYHAFGEINEDTTAAIIEIGFLNLDREYLVENTDQITVGIVNGLLCYLNQEEIAAP